MTYPNNKRDPTLAWVARRSRVTSPNTARTVAELAGFKGVVANGGAQVDFNHRKMAWLDHLAEDTALSPAAFRVAYIIANFMNRETGKAWPTQETLASKAGLTARAVREQVKVLLACGYLNCTFGGGRHKPNVYTIGDKETRKKTSPFEKENPEGNFPLSCVNPEVSRQKPGRKLPTELLYELHPSSKAEELAAQTAERAHLQAEEKVVPLRPAADPTDFRAKLFGEGLHSLAVITGRKAHSLRSLVAKWLNQTSDDAKAVLRAIEDARDDRAMDPISRIEERLFGDARRNKLTSSFDPSFMFRRH